MRINLKAAQEDVRKIAIAIFLAVMLSVMLNGESFRDNLVSIATSIFIWLLAIVEFKRPAKGGKQ